MIRNGLRHQLEGFFTIIPAVDSTTRQFLLDFNETRHIKRHDMSPEYGFQGEFYICPTYLDPYADKIVDGNKPGACLDET
ncbi:MAG: hypothetical protein ACYCQJ_13535 [Nitrososphaerales archaeon]